MESLRYRLQYFGVPLEGPANIFCDNKSMVTNVSVPTSMLNNQHNTICYHHMRELQTAGNIRVGWIPGDINLGYLLMKTTMAGNVRHSFAEFVFHNKAAKCKYDRNNDGRKC